MEISSEVNQVKLIIVIYSTVLWLFFSGNFFFLLCFVFVFLCLSEVAKKWLEKEEKKRKKSMFGGFTWFLVILLRWAPGLDWHVNDVLTSSTSKTCFRFPFFVSISSSVWGIHRIEETQLIAKCETAELLASISVMDQNVCIQKSKQANVRPFHYDLLW